MAETNLKLADIREMETLALMELVEAKREELFKLRLEWVTGSLEDPNQVRAVRKDLARMLTIIRERELAAALVGREDNA
jgi:large subunit ribosomal protein L29